MNLACVVLGAVSCLATLGCADLEPSTRRADMIRAHNAAAGQDAGLLRAYAEEHPEDRGVALALAKLEASEGGAQDQPPSVGTDIGEPEACVLAWQASVTKDPARREALARRAAEKDLGLSSAHFQLGCALWDQGRHDDAIESIREAARLAPARGGVWFALANFQVQAGHFADAVPSALQAVNLSWTFDEGYPWGPCQLLADLYERDGRFPAAAERYRAMATRPTGKSARDFYPALPERSDGRALPTPFEDAPVFGVVFATDARDPLRVARVLRHSTAAAAGVTSGDRLLALNGVRLASPAEAGDHAAKPCAGPWSFTVERSGAETALSADPVSGAEARAGFRAAIDAGLGAEKAKDARRAADAFGEAIDIYGCYNAALVVRWAGQTLGCGRAADADRFLRAWLRSSPRETNILMTLAQLHCLAAQAADSGLVTTRAAAAEFARRASAEAPDDGLCAAYAASFEDDIGDIDMWGDLEPCRATGGFERALALGNGGWALEQLAGRLDSVENSLRSAEAARQEQIAQAVLTGMFLGVAGTATGVTPAFGANPWKDYGYKAQAIYGPTTSGLSGLDQQVWHMQQQSMWGY